MRVEMFGTAFTAQHSDARVTDQLVYKWSHSRAVIATVLVQEYEKLIETGWKPTRAEKFDGIILCDSSVVATKNSWKSASLKITF